MSSISSGEPASLDTDSTVGDRADASTHRHHVRHPHHSNHIISQVAEWLHSEKAKQATRRSGRLKRHAKHAVKSVKASTHVSKPDEVSPHDPSSARSSSDLTDTSFALEQLEKILSHSSSRSSHGGPTTHTGEEARPSLHRHKSRKSSKLLRKKMSFGAISDGEAKEEVQVPSAEVTLDNTKIHMQNSRRSSLDRSWSYFKREIVRLTHTLTIPGWRRLAIDDGSRIEVQRLSGALTNAVYVVLPPKDLTEPSSRANESSVSITQKRRPR